MSSILQSHLQAPGRFGPYGGRYVPETLMVPLFELERAYEQAQADPAFQARLTTYSKISLAVPRLYNSLSDLPPNSAVRAFT